MASGGFESNSPILARHRSYLDDSRTRTALLSLVLAISTFVIYYPAHTHPFCSLDDHLYIVDNVNLHSLNWKTVVWAFTALNMANWIPVSWLSHALDYQLFGLNPAGHHLVNVSFHALNVVLLFWVLKRATGYTGRSFMVAALFAVHPMNVEPVVWVAELKTMLSTAFFLLALDAYRRYAIEPRVGRFRVVTLLFALGLMAKPQVITLPFVLLLWDYWPLQRMLPPAATSPSVPPVKVFPAASFSSLVKEKVPLFILCGIAVCMTIATQGMARPQYQPPLALRLGNAILSYFRYIGKAVWPSAMAPEYPYPHHLGTWQVLGALVFLLAITAAVVSARRHRYLVVGWFWFLGTLVPTVGLIQVGQQALADRYTYESFLGLFIIVCWGVSDWANRRHISVTWLASASALVLLALTMVTYRQIGYWQDELTLWSHASQVVEHHWLAQRNLAAVLMQRGNIGEALEHYRRGVDMNPADTQGVIGIAVCEQKLGNPTEAIVRYKQALQDYTLTDMDRTTILINLAVAYRDLGDTTTAQRYYDQAMFLRGHSR